MTVLFALWSFAGLTLFGFLFVGSRRLKSRNVSYQFGWTPLSFFSDALTPFLKHVGEQSTREIKGVLHRIFHTIFHRLKSAHDSIFGRQGAKDEAGTPSFFLKTIAEHKEEHGKKYGGERSEGF
jgi:hypothetical protein